MKRRNRGLTAYQQTLFNKYEIDESYLQTRKQRRACMELLEKIDRNQEVDEKKTIEKIASVFQGSELYKRIASSVTIAALLVTLQSTPVMAQAATKLQTAAAMTSITEQYRDKSVVLDEDSFVNSKAAAYSQEVKATSLHLVAGKAASNVYEPLEANRVLIDEDSDVLYYPKQEAKTLTVIDTSVDGWETLRDGVKSGEILLLEGNEAPIDSILSKLEAMGEIDCLNIISHGDGGRLGFENGTIDSEVLEANRESWKRLSHYLGKDGDIQLFGCNIAKGEEGKKFIEKMAQITGADVAASINPTGAEKQGGNWKLEAVTGEVAGNLPFTKQAISQFSYLLPLTVEDQEFSLSDATFADNGDTVDNSYFSISGKLDSGASAAMAKNSVSAYHYVKHTNTGFQIIVDADGTYLDTFELEDLSLSLSEEAANNGYGIYNIQIKG
ncbi:MAG TPA: DUF4347 domain-containing protein, partial [Negativicutes bacterium]|nr:DUF4347 domain-containing protein [Negativicutes bacterium]